MVAFGGFDDRCLKLDFIMGLAGVVGWVGGYGRWVKGDLDEDEEYKIA